MHQSYSYTAGFYYCRLSNLIFMDCVVGPLTSVQNNEL